MHLSTKDYKYSDEGKEVFQYWFQVTGNAIDLQGISKMEGR